MAVDFSKTKFSDIDLDFVKQYLRIEPDMTEDDIELTLLIETAKGFVTQHTDMDEQELDSNKAVNIIFLKLVSDLYHNRSATTLGTNLAMDPIFELMLKNVRKITL